MKRLMILVSMCLLLGCEADTSHTKADVGRLEKFIDTYKPRVIVIDKGYMTKEYLDMAVQKGYKVECANAQNKTIMVVKND